MTSPPATLGSEAWTTAGMHNLRRPGECPWISHFVASPSSGNDNSRVITPYFFTKTPSPSYSTPFYMAEDSLHHSAELCGPQVSQTLGPCRGGSFTCSPMLGHLNAMGSSSGGRFGGLHHQHECMDFQLHSMGVNDRLLMWSPSPSPQLPMAAMPATCPVREVDNLMGSQKTMTSSLRKVLG